MSIVTVLLNENNFFIQSKAVRMALGAKEKLSFIDGRMIEPPITSSEYDKWMRQDCMMCSWLNNSTAPEIRDHFMFTDSARKLWLELVQTYGACNAPMVYQIQRDISNFSQGSLSVVAYYSKLKKLWDQLNELEPIPSCICIAECRCDMNVEINKRERRHKILKFVLGLNSRFDATKDQILVMDPLSTINQAYFMILSVERKTTITESSVEMIEKNFALMVKNYGDNRRFVDRNRKGGIPVCEHYNGKGHIKDNCFKLKGYPEWWNTRNP